ncbi:MAG: hypothetical protein EOP04_16740, partial [Proteobacteria bacterium]
MKNNRGFGVAEVLISLAIAGFLGLVAAQLLGNLNRTVSHTTALQNVSEIRLDILKSLEAHDSFLTILKAPVNDVPFSCIRAASDCKGQGGEFTVLNVTPTGVTSVNPYVRLSSEPNVGFNKLGKVCNDFNETAGSDNCPFRYEAVWTAYCPKNQNIRGLLAKEERCRNPLLDIAVTLKVRPKTAESIGPLNPASMNIRLTKSQVETDAEKICQMLGPGAYITGGNCVVPAAANVSCENAFGPSIQALVKGFGSNGEPLCSPTIMPAIKDANNLTGTKGKVLLGMNEKGEIAVGPGIIPVLISTGAINNRPMQYTG